MELGSGFWSKVFGVRFEFLLVVWSSRGAKRQTAYSTVKDLGNFLTVASPDSFVAIFYLSQTISPNQVLTHAARARRALVRATKL